MMRDSASTTVSQQNEKKNNYLASIKPFLKSGINWTIFQPAPQSSNNKYTSATFFM
jgi:hypothetical protein